MILCRLWHILLFFPPVFLCPTLFHLVFVLLKPRSSAKGPLTFAFIPLLFVSAVIQLIPGAATPATFPANDGRVALPVQAFWQHREHHR